MNGKVYQKQGGTLVEITPRIAALGGSGKTYSGVAPIVVDNTADNISVTDATASSKGVVQVGNNLDVASGVVSVKPYADYEADHADVDVSSLQDGAIVVTNESIGYPTAVLAEVEQTLTSDANKVPTSAAVKAELAKKADVLAELYVSPTGSDDNDGLTAATALATPQEAMNRINSSCASGPVYAADYPNTRGKVTVHIAAGAYTGDMMVVSGNARIVLGGNVTISGDVFSNTGSTISVVPEDGVTATLTCASVLAQLMATLTFTDVNITTGRVASGWGSYLSLEGSANTLSITTTGDTSALNSTQNSSLRLRIGTVIIDSTAMNSTTHYPINAQYNSTIYYRPTTVTISFTRAAGVFRTGFNSAIALESSGSTTITGTVTVGTAVSTGSSLLVRTSGIHTMSGTVTGRRYFVDVHSYMRPSASTNQNFFLGSTDGTVDTATYGVYK